MLKIVSAPNNILNSPTQPVIEIDDKVKKLVYEMEETLTAQIDPQGVGLAAPQVGSPLKLFLIKPSPKSQTEVFINPVILKREAPARNASLAIAGKRTTNSERKKKNSKLEGCLSIPRIWGPVKRSERVLIQYQGLDGIEKTHWFEGIKATIIQHEVDHLNGVLFTQRALEQNTILYEEKGGEFIKLNS